VFTPEDDVTARRKTLRRALAPAALAAAGCITALAANPAAAQEQDLPRHLRDRGLGVPVSQFGIYIRRGELLVYPYYEYYRDGDYEYKPQELGYGLDQDFRGRYRAHEGLLWLGYGVTDRLAVEIEAAVITANLETSTADPSGIPSRIEASGIGDVEGQLRLRLMEETPGRPELFGYFEAVAPVQTRKLLIATLDWELTAGFGLIRAFPWGTMTLRLSAEYPLEERSLAFGEYALEYLRRWSPRWRTYVAVEGTEDEVEFITEAQWRVSRNVIVKLNNAFGITSKAPGWAPEIGVMFSLPVGR
jgi:hypothetical protein